MSTPPDAGARPRRILVVANETCASQGMVDEVLYRAGKAGEVMVVAPVLARSRLEHWLSSDAERRRDEAQGRLDASVEAFTAAGLTARGQLGDADPLQALDDALRVYDADEVVISTHPHDRSNWLERQVVRKARERYDVPITHVVVDLEHESAVADADRRYRPRSQGRGSMRVFHLSEYDEAIAIREGGFRDAPAGGDRSGVWVSDRPPAGDGGVLFVVDVPADLVEGFEQPGDSGADERRFLMPAELLNRHGPPVAEGDWSE
jgi:hypothetical protein